MGDANTNGGTGGDTPESFKAERENFEKCIACIGQLARNFDALAEQAKQFDPERIAFHLQLKGPHLNICVWAGIFTPQAFQWFKPAMESQKALGEQILKDVAAVGEAMVRWAEDLEMREEQYRLANLEQQTVRGPSGTTVGPNPLGYRLRDPVNGLDPNRRCEFDSNNAKPSPNPTPAPKQTLTSGYNPSGAVPAPAPTPNQSEYSEYNSDSRLAGIDNKLPQILRDASDISINLEMMVLLGVHPELSEVPTVSQEATSVAADAADSALTTAGDDTVSLFHQGNLEDGVSEARSLSTSPSSDLLQYDLNGKLYQFKVPRITLNQWLDTGEAQQFTDFHAPSGVTIPEIRIWPPASGQMNQYLIHNSR